MEKKKPQLETRKLQMRKIISKGNHKVKVGNHLHTNMTSKPAIVRRGEYKCMILEMHWKLKDRQLKTILCVCGGIYILLDQNLMVTANQKFTMDTHTQKKERRTKEEGKEKDLQKHN